MSADDRIFAADRSDRVRVWVSGPDRARFLNNLCTNDIKRLKPGQGCEAFVTSPQGKTLAWITVAEEGEHLLVRADPGGLDSALPHFAKYSVFDDVEIGDMSDTTFEVHFAGAGVVDWLGGWLGAAAIDAPLGGSGVGWNALLLTLVRESPLGPEGITVIGHHSGSTDFAIEWKANLPASGRTLTNEEADGMRIAAGTPAFGRDIQLDNLPQEIGRDAQAISFVKGCYLGQETVARLDALGHVNKLLRRIVVEDGDPPTPGISLAAVGVDAGKFTSSGRSPDGRPVALAMLRVKPAPPGTSVSWDGGCGVVAELAPER